MSISNDKKRKQLGMPLGTASNKLRKEIMFTLLKDAGLNYCHQCGEEILDSSTLSIEHKVPWLDSEDPAGTFFDLDNIAFSHLSCNCKAARRPAQKYFTPEERKAADNKQDREQRAKRTKDQKVTEAERRKTWPSYNKKY